MTVIASRASWSPRYSDGFEVIGTSGWREIYVHHTVTAVPGGAGASVEQERQHMRDLEGIGQREFGGGISYTVIVFPSGRAYQGHSLTTQGAHTYQRNNIARAICFVGNFENEQPTAAAMSTACDVLAEWRAAGFPYRVTGGHRDVYSTACPGRNLYARLSQLTADNGGSTQEDDVSADDVLFNKKIKGPKGDTAYNLNDMTYWTNQFANLIPAIATKLDTLGKVVAEIADKDERVELTDEQAEKLGSQIEAMLTVGLDELVEKLDGLSKDDMREVLRESRLVFQTGSTNPDGGL